MEALPLDILVYLIDLLAEDDEEDIKSLSQTWCHYVANTSSRPSVSTAN